MTRDPPQIAALGLTSFVCPHCGALAQQQWAELCAKFHQIDDPIRPADRQYIEKILSETEPDEENGLRKIADAMLAEDPRVVKTNSNLYEYPKFENLCASRCFSCDKIAIWLQAKLIYPTAIYTIEPNPDLPAEVLADFNEAALILSLSPRGAAALLRLAIQRLCISLGKKGSIDEMIGDLVSDGLSKRVQRALDIVRVIGNESVHPGTIDVRDTPEVAEHLFSLVNLIADKVISEPRHIDERYSTLPLEKLSSIERRNQKALAGPEEKAKPTTTA